MATKNILKLIDFILKSGASDAVVFKVDDIETKKSLAEQCIEPKCENYGLSKNCPPYIDSYEVFKEKLKQFDKCIFFKIDIPKSILFSSDNVEVFALLHEIASQSEHFAIKNGFQSAKGYAGGSCKVVFCYDYPECSAISAKKMCRFPESVRESMSGFGIDVGKLAKKAGWKNNLFSDEEISSVYGLLLLKNNI